MAQYSLGRGKEQHLSRSCHVYVSEVGLGFARLVACRSKHSLQTISIDLTLIIS
jgi:hypothetical protein